jgi:hypothetical protein
VRRSSGADALVTEEPEVFMGPVRVCGGPGRVTAGPTRQPTGGDSGRLQLGGEVVGCG